MVMFRLAVSKQIVEQVAEPGFKDGDLSFGHRHVLGPVTVTVNIIRSCFARRRPYRAGAAA
jgi:hypothetical protein